MLVRDVQVPVHHVEADGEEIKFLIKIKVRRAIILYIYPPLKQRIGGTPKIL
jgi:hypothetical protein